jgi:hypothetical protein
MPSEIHLLACGYEARSAPPYSPDGRTTKAGRSGSSSCANGAQWLKNNTVGGRELRDYAQG